MLVKVCGMWRNSQRSLLSFVFVLVGEVLVTCQLHQSQQNTVDSTNSTIGQDSKPPPLPPKKRHSKYFDYFKMNIFHITASSSFVSINISCAVGESILMCLLKSVCSVPICGLLW